MEKVAPDELLYLLSRNDLSVSLTNGTIIQYTLLFYKNLFYKNVEAEFCLKFKNILRTLPRLRAS